MIDNKTILVVTGIPRSGTSLMMQILHDSGLEILTDNLRESDVNNPKGYFEYAPVKGIVKDKSFLIDTLGKAIKIVAPLPMYLDLELKYKVIFMRRDIEEILMSQEKMLGKDQSSEREKFSSIYNKHIQLTKNFFENNNIEFIEVQYNNLFNSLDKEIKSISHYLDIDMDLEKVSKIIDPSLYRNKKEK